MAFLRLALEFAVEVLHSRTDLSIQLKVDDNYTPTRITFLNVSVGCKTGLAIGYV